MDMLPTLCAAMKRAGGDALVLRTGESPHVLTGSGRQNVARAVLSANALEALVTQIFSEPEAAPEPVLAAQSDDITPVEHAEPQPWYEVSIGAAAEGPVEPLP